MADRLLALVLSGAKTATCSEARYAPKVGAQVVIEDGAGTPRCVLETISVELRRFGEVDADFAHAEGEGDLSLAYWRQAHEAFFRRASSFTPDMNLACERFRIVEVIYAERAL